MTQSPKVSVCMITYNHEKYIEEAINGVLMQNCDFEIELIIANDCSPDQTNAIVNKIIETHPKGSLIRYYRQEFNVGIIPNFLFALNQCKGEFVAMCEGDDYWITEDKLQKQVDILNSNDNLGLVFTGVQFYYVKENKFVNIPSRIPLDEDQIIQKMLESKFIEFPTTLFRKSILNNAIKVIKPELINAIIGDTRILLETARNSKIYFLNEITTVYRIIDGSASHPVNVDKFILALNDTYLCRRNFVIRYKLNYSWLSNSICNTNRGLINNAFISKKYSNTIKFLKHLIILDSFKYCNWNIFKNKMTGVIWIKLVLSIVGFGVFRQKIK